MDNPAVLFRLCMLLLLQLFFLQSLISQEYLTFRNIYDYDIGDERHYHNVKIAGSSMNPGLVYDECVNIIVADKHFSSGNDTIFYTENYCASRIMMDGDIWDTSMVRQVFYAELDYTLYNFYTHFAFPNNSNPDYCNGRIFNSVSQPLGESGDWNKKYVEGLGETVYHSFSVGQGQYDKTDHVLVYYRKGTEEWGNKYPVSASNPNISISPIRLYPNPCTDVVLIKKTVLGKATLIVNDIHGLTVLTEAFESETKELNTSHWISGVYIISVIGERTTESIQLLVE